MIRVIQADITTLRVDAIVNAANETLLGGAGVDGAIHKAAGPALLDECRRIGGCPTGEARITMGYKLLADYVIHTVGPVWRGGGFNEAILLRKAYASCLALASERGIKSIAFPNISTGVYGFPKNLAAEIAISVVAEYKRSNTKIEEVIFACWDAENYEIYVGML